MKEFKRKFYMWRKVNPVFIWLRRKSHDIKLCYRILMMKRVTYRDVCFHTERAMRGESK